MTQSPPSFPTSRFVQLYWLYAIPIVALTMVLVSWVISLRWNDPNFNAPSLGNMLIIFSVPAVLSTVLSFVLPYFYFRRWASQGLATGAFSIPRFTLIFYGL